MKPVNVGLVILRGSTNSIKQKVPLLLEKVLPQVRQKLYVKLEVPSNSDFFDLVPYVYRKASTFVSDVDLRVLLGRRREIPIDSIFEEKANEFIPKKLVGCP